MKSFLFVLALGLACAPVRADSEAVSAAPPAEPTETITVTPDEPAAAPRNPGCIRATGTRIVKRDKNGCTGAPGQSYSRDEIDRTGATNVGDALRRLSPSVTVGGG